MRKKLGGTLTLPESSVRRVLGRDIALSRPRFQAARGEAHVDVVHLAIAFRWSEAQKVLAVQLVGDVGKCGAEILSEANLCVAAAGLLRHKPEARIRKVRRQRRLQ